MKARERAVALLVLGIVLAVIVRANRRENAPRAPRSEPPANGRAAATTGDQLQRTIETMQLQLRREPPDARAAVALADALLRQARVASNAGLAITAEQALQRVLKSEP